MGPIFTSMGFGVQNDPPKGGSKGVIGPPKFFAIYLGSYQTPKRGEVKIHDFFSDQSTDLLKSSVLNVEYYFKENLT